MYKLTEAVEKFIDVWQPRDAYPTLYADLRASEHIFLS